MPRMGLAEHPSIPLARALRGRIHRAQSSAAELSAAAGRDGVDGAEGEGSRARAGWAAPTEAFGVGRCVAADRGLEMQTSQKQKLIL